VPGIHVFTAQQQAKTWMAGTSPAMTDETDAAQARPSRVKRIASQFVMPAHSRPKDGVLSHAYVAGIHVLAAQQQAKTWMAGTSPAMTAQTHYLPCGLETLNFPSSCPALCRASTSY
jgi:hypothetical protein